MSSAQLSSVLEINNLNVRFATPEGEVISEADWNAGQDQWLAKPEDLEYLKNLMTAVTEPGEYASWIAPPRIGVDNKEGDFEYVRIQ